MKKVIAPLLALVLISGGLGSLGHVEASSHNNVAVDFTTAYRHTAAGDLFVSVANVPVEGSKEANAGIWNNGTVLVVDPVLTFTPADGIDIKDVMRQDLVSESPYTWALPTIGVGGGLRRFAWARTESFNFTPGFSTSRTLDKIDFAGPDPHPQHLVISTTVKEAGLNWLNIMVRIIDDGLVDAIITDVPAVSGGGNADLWPDFRTASIRIENPTVGATYIQTVDIEVQLKAGVDSAIFKPRIDVDVYRPANSGDSPGTSVSGATELGDWEWTTTDSYPWHWVKGLVTGVIFPEVQGGMEEPVNDVVAGFDIILSYTPEGDSFTNGEVTGTREWRGGLTNRLFDTGEPVAGMTLTLESDIPFEDIDRRDLVVEEPPLYVWFLNDVPAGASDGRGVSDPSPILFTPGFDASRTADITQFSEFGTQILTIRATPRGPMPVIDVNVSLPQHPAVNAVITDETGGEEGWLSPDGQQLHIWLSNPEVDTEYTFTITIEVTPLEGPVEFMPSVRVSDGSAPTPVSPAGTGSGVTHSVSGLGTWSIDTSGIYPWGIVQESTISMIRWDGYPGEPGGPPPPQPPPDGNVTSWEYLNWWGYTPPDDTFVNGEVVGRRWWQANVDNRPDGTRQPVTALQLRLESDLALDWNHLGTDPTLVSEGPPTYEWAFSDVPQGDSAGVWVYPSDPDYPPVTFTPGVDVSRSVDVFEFTQDDGTQIQTLTIEVTPQVEMEWFLVFVGADKNPLIPVDEYDLVEAVITLVPDGGDLSPDGRLFQMVVPVPAGDVGQSIVFEFTIEVAPKVPRAQYMPAVWVATVEEIIGSGPTSGTSHSLTVDLLGTWNWSAEGDYVSDWIEVVLKVLTFPEIQSGIEGFSIEHMSVDFDNRPSHDKIAISEATFSLRDDVTYDLAVDDVIVSVDGVIITIPAGSFVQGKGGDYVFKTPKGVEPKVEMKLNLDKGEWSFKVDRIDASAIDNYDGVDVTLIIGFMVATERINMRVGGLTYIAEE